MSRTVRIAFVLPLFLLALTAGCSGKGNMSAAKVSGKVTYNGSPVTGGSVTFHYANMKDEQGHDLTNQSVSCTIGPDGTYSNTDMPVGDTVVTVETESAKHETASAADYAQKMGGKMAGKGGGKIEASPAPPGFEGNKGGAYVKIPAKYADKSSSGLKKNLSRGSNTFDIPLSD